MFSPQESVTMIFPPHSYTPPIEIGVAKPPPLIESKESANKPTERKTLRKLPKTKTDDTVSTHSVVAS